MSLLQHCFTADAKFLTSFRIIVITIMTWCGLYIFFLFNFGTTLSLLSSFNRELRQRCSMHVNRKWDLYLSFIKLCHETHMSISNSLNRTLCPKIWASYCSAEYCPRMQKTHFRLTCIGLKTSFKLTIKLLNIINMQNVAPLFLFSLDLPNLCQGQGAWICGFPFTRVFIPPRFSSPLSTNIYCFYYAF